VVDSRDVAEGNSIKRRRECLGCGKRFTTYETVEFTAVLVVKNNGIRQPFDSSKVRAGIIKACEKTKVSMNSINAAVMEIEQKVANWQDQEISTKTIGEMVMQQLEKLDEVAYIRFASVYRQFADITAFVGFIKEYSSNK